MIDQAVKKFVLRRLLQKGEPLAASEIKLAICAAFTAAFTPGELDTYLTQMEEANVVAFSKDELEQILIGLTPKGKMAAERLIKLS